MRKQDALEPKGREGRWVGLETVEDKEFPEDVMVMELIAMGTPVLAFSAHLRAVE